MPTKFNCDFTQSFPQSKDPNNGSCLSSEETRSPRSAVLRAKPNAEKYAKPGRIHVLVYRANGETVAEHTGNSVDEAAEGVLAKLVKR